MTVEIATMDFMFLQMAILVLFMSAYFEETRSGRRRGDKHLHAEHDQEGTASKSCVPKNLMGGRFRSIRHLFLSSDRLRTSEKTATAWEGLLSVSTNERRGTRRTSQL